MRYPTLVTVAMLVACSNPPAPPADVSTLDAVVTDGAPSDQSSPDVAASDAIDDASPDAQDAGPSAAPCDPIGPTRCGLPFPNDYWTRLDPSTPTRIRLDFNSEMLPRSTPRWFNEYDGFSPASSPMAHLPGAVATGLVDPRNMARSLEPSSLTAIIDTMTGQRVAHFAEIDVTATDPAQRALILRPAQNLVFGRRYVVAIRGVRDSAGAVIAPSPAFRAMRDDLATAELSLAQRERYTRIFSDLQRASVPRAELQLAWDFTVASRQSIQSRLVSMRDQALAAVGTEGAAYRITNVRMNPRAGIYAHIEGQVTVPLFMDDPEPGGRLNVAPDGTIRQNGTAQYSFWMVVPNSAMTAPAGVLAYGHGLLSSGVDVFSDRAIGDLANGTNLIVFAMDLQGMANEDGAVILQALSGPDLGRFRVLIERQHQGIINWLVMMRTMTGRMRSEPALQIGGRSAIDPTRRFYYGASQGGIFGGTYMALTTDVERGVLMVPGQAYNLLLQRSSNFRRFEDILRPRFPNGLDIPRLLETIQLHWDRTEPSGWTPNIRTDRVAGTPAHEVLMLVAIGDRQVTTLGAHMMARSIGGVPNLAPVNREIFGLESRMGMHTGSAMIEFDFALPEPLDNTPPTGTPDPHSRIGESAPVFMMAPEWLATGATQNRCDGPCNPG
ncbi:MAG: hypothetical protein JNK05_38165 [Myxococcales bacterium]|nr:hypothetical protein [Myxococcales bacterium]